LYYLLSMILAVCLGIALVYAIRPGRDKPFAGNSFSSCNSNVTATYVYSYLRYLVMLLRFYSIFERWGVVLALSLPC
jgi:hypothetical protein